jgi:hypothetical protein
VGAIAGGTVALATMTAGTVTAGTIAATGSGPFHSLAPYAMTALESTVGGVAGAAADHYAVGAPVTGIVVGVGAAVAYKWWRRDDG